MTHQCTINSAVDEDTGHNAADKLADSLVSATLRCALDVEALAARVDAVLDDDLYWFPVKHHSPMVARHVRRVIHRRRPRVIFLEAPSEAQSLVEHIVDRKTQPPIAIYSSFRDSTMREDEGGEEKCTATWYPLVSYSPEYVTMLAAKEVGADVVFIDLPHWALKGAGRAEPHDVDQLIVESSFYKSLASATGYRTWDEAWDTLFEIDRPDRDSEAFRRELATFCAAARATSSPQRIAADGTLARERYMRRVMRDALAARNMLPADAMVVCGGFHLFMHHDDHTPPPDVPRGTVRVTAVPYSYFRISELSGYAAGNRAPGWYQTCWDLAERVTPTDMSADPSTDTLTAHVVATLTAARRRGEPLSPADAIAVTQHSRLLANLRGRAAPILDDLHDALITCCCKGDPDYEGRTLRAAMDAVDIGTAIGRVTDSLGRLPLVADFYEQLDTLGLSHIVDHERVTPLELDTRDELAARRSAFLHRVQFLGVALGQQRRPSGDPYGRGVIFRERWDLCWSPELEPALVEKSLVGNTIEAASLRHLRDTLVHRTHHAADACWRLFSAVQMDLPDMLPNAERAVGEAIDTDDRFVSLARALSWLTDLDRQLAYRSMRRERLSELIERCYDRACFALPEVANAPESEWDRVLSALRSLAEVSVQHDGLDGDLFVGYAQQAAELTRVPFLRGALRGMLAEVRRVEPQAIADELAAYAQAPPDVMVTAGDFLDGVMAMSRTTLMLGAEPLVRAVDALLAAAEWEQFLTMLPRLRGAFERLRRRSRDAFAHHAALLLGVKEPETLTLITASAEGATIIARIDRRMADIMKEWEL